MRWPPEYPRYVSVCGLFAGDDIEVRVEPASSTGRLRVALARCAGAGRRLGAFLVQSGSGRRLAEPLSVPANYVGRSRSGRARLIWRYDRGGMTEPDASSVLGYHLSLALRQLLPWVSPIWQAACPPWCLSIWRTYFLRLGLRMCRTGADGRTGRGRYGRYRALPVTRVWALQLG